MINGIMKLFYTEVVKNKMSKLPNGDRKSTRLNSSHSGEARMPSSA